jgi:pyridoxamine 5'-phosphate oxidase
MLDPPGADPFEVFDDWYRQAQESAQAEPEAMALGTSPPDGRVSVRFVLMRGFDRRGFVFYTNRRSRKGEELAVNPWAAVNFRWSTVDRQVRAAGPVEWVSEAESDAYFAGRPRPSQLGAWASDQSRPVGGRDELDRQLVEAEQRFAGGPVPRPAWWGGYRVVPHEFEFWQQGTFRMHDRFQYKRLADGTWSCERLNP